MLGSAETWEEKKGEASAPEEGNSATDAKTVKRKRKKEEAPLSEHVAASISTLLAFLFS